MAISKNSSIDFAKIALEMRSTVARWYNADVQIVDPNLGDVEWNEFTNEYENNPATVIWSGKARVQPLRTATVPDLTVMQGSVRAIRVQVPYDADLSLIRKGMQVKVVNGGEDHVLENLSFVVRSAVNSSYGWNRTIECDVDIKNGE